MEGKGREWRPISMGTVDQTDSCGVSLVFILFTPPVESSTSTQATHHRLPSLYIFIHTYPHAIMESSQAYVYIHIYIRIYMHICIGIYI
jgi:hypothetical protein